MFPVVRRGVAVYVEGDGDAVEWAVKMTRLPEEATLKAVLGRQAVGPELLGTLATRLARFHAAAEGGPGVSALGRFEVVAGNARENFLQSQAQVGGTVSVAVFERLRALTEDHLRSLRPLIEDRAERGVPRDTHGDLRLDHVYLFPERSPPDDVVIIDCVEFSERFRYADPVNDVAFLVMDLAYHGRRDLARSFASSYFREAGDEEGRALLPFYSAYRAVVRAKVAGLKQAEPEVTPNEREAARASAWGHWLLALGELEEPLRKPCLLLVGGLPGTGKSTLARNLAQRANFTVIRSDVVRKDLAGVSANEPNPSFFAEGIYANEWTERTYAECLRRAEGILFEGGRVLIDATFREDRRRRMFLDAAGRNGIPGRVFLCRADAGIVRERLRLRRGDASDADWSVYQETVGLWQEPSPAVLSAVYYVDTGGSPEEALAFALDQLRHAGLAGS